MEEYKWSERHWVIISKKDNHHLNTLFPLHSLSTITNIT